MFFFTRKSLDDLLVNEICKGNYDKAKKLALKAKKRDEQAFISGLDYAVKQNKNEMVRFLLENGRQNLAWERSALLCHAVQNQNIEITKLLIEKGADVNYISQDKNISSPPIMIAAAKGFRQITCLLVENGAIICSESLKAAIRFNHIEIVGYFVEQGATIDENLFAGAVYEYKEEIVKLFIDMGIKYKNIDLNYGLLKAAFNGKPELVKILLEMGADINCMGRFDTGGYSETTGTPLILAIQNQHLEIVKYLLSKGGDVNKTGCYGETPLMVAVEKGSADIVELLLEKGATTELIGSDGCYRNKTVFNLASNLYQYYKDDGNAFWKDATRKTLDLLQPFLAR